MSNILSDDTKTIILLCGNFGKDRSVNPLTQTDYNALDHWLAASKMRPSDLLQTDAVADASMVTGIERQRLAALLGRGAQLGFAVEEWQRDGIWIISRSDNDYPERYNSRLNEKAPPLLFGTGDRALLRGGGLAIIGSRYIDADAQSFTRQTADACALNGMPVVSGGARGVDQIAMTGALSSGGISIGVLADNLLRKSLEREARNAISENRLLLISPYHPKAVFTVGTAMSRNKLIYAMADYALVVSAEHKKGGTWAGAEEELKRENAVTVFVRTGGNIPPGNKKLMEMGAVSWPDRMNMDNLQRQLTGLAVNRQETDTSLQINLFDVH
jgi:predicted Rossmann fold nucleotide-binding protein DprA/Smf involved in DNA uptake